MIALSRIGIVEVAAGLGAKHPAHAITRDEYDDALDNLLDDAEEQYQIIAVDQSIVDLAVQLTRRRKLRGCDAIQLASALSLHQTLLNNNLLGITFVCADTDLLAAAQSEGMSTENPNLHPYPQS